MKPTAVILSLLTFHAVATPTPEELGLEPRDKWCTLASGIPEARCRKGFTTAFQKVRDVKSTDRFGVQCKCHGQQINANAYHTEYVSHGLW